MVRTSLADEHREGGSILFCTPENIGAPTLESYMYWIPHTEQKYQHAMSRQLNHNVSGDVTWM